jgi:hypothetical protein
MSQKTDKAIRRAAVKYAVREEQKIAKYLQSQIYGLPFFHRLCYALGVIFKWGNDGSQRGRSRGSRQGEKT